jgi:formiminoglutamase
VNNWLTTWDFHSPIDVGVISVPSSKTSIKHNGAFAATNALLESFVVNTTYSPDYDVDIATLKARYIGDVAIPSIDPARSLLQIEETLLECYRQPEDFFPMVLGGDHAVTAPSIRAFCRAHPSLQVGIVHFDAHNDVRVLDHGPTNGTPIRQVLQSGHRVAGRNLVQVGIHGFMNASYYKRWVEGQGGTIFTGRQCRRDGMEGIIRKAIEIAGRESDAIYVTVDIDVLELGYAPGTPAATSEGIHPVDLFDALFILGQEPKVAAIDFVELDPYRDLAQITTRTFGTAMLTFMAGLFLRRHDGWRGYDPTPIKDEQSRTLTRDDLLRTGAELPR